MAGILGALGAGAVIGITIQAIDKFSKTFTKANISIGKLGKIAATGALVIGAAVVGIGVSAVKTAAEFETAFTGVKKTVDLTEEEFKDLENRFKTLSTEIPITFVELSHIGEIAGQLGVEGVDNIAKFTKTIADISVTTNLSAEQAATDFARIANVMGVPISEVDRMGSAIVDLGNNFATSEGEIVDMTMRIMGAGKTIGLNTQEVFGMSAAMSALGIRSEMGGSAISRAMITISKAVAGGGKVMIDNNALILEGEESLKELESQLSLAALRQSEFTENTKESTRVSAQLKIDKITNDIIAQKDAITELIETNGQMMEVSGEELKKYAEVSGMSIEEFSSAWKEKPVEAMSAVIMGLKNISDEGGNTFGMLEELDLSSIRITDTMLRLAGSEDGVTKAVEMSKTAWEENTALVAEAEKRYATFESQVKMLGNESKLLFEELGKELIPVLVDLFKVIKDDVLPALAPLIPIIGDALVGVIKMLAPHLPKLAELFTRLVGVVMRLLDALMPIIEPLLEIGMIIIDVLLGSLESLIPFIELLALVLTPILELLTPIVELLGDFAKFVQKIDGGVISGIVGLFGGGGDMPSYQTGGIVSQTGPAFVHKGETIIPANQTGGGITVIVEGNVYGTDPDEMAEAMAMQINKVIRL